MDSVQTWFKTQSIRKSSKTTNLNQDIVSRFTVVMFVLLLIKKREIEVSHTIGGERGKVVSKGKGSVEGVDTTLVSNTLR